MRLGISKERDEAWIDRCTGKRRSGDTSKHNHDVGTRDPDGRIQLKFVALLGVITILCGLVPKLIEVGVERDGPSRVAMTPSTSPPSVSPPVFASPASIPLGTSEPAAAEPEFQKPQVQQVEESHADGREESDDPSAGLDRALRGLAFNELEAARRIVGFFQTGNMSEIRDLEPETVERLAEQIIKNVPLERMARTLETQLHFPRWLTLESKDPKALLVELFESARGEDTPTRGRTSLVFTDMCDRDGRVSGFTHIIPSGVSRVYAVFENAGRLQELEHVVAVWRDVHNERLTFMECEPLRKNSNYNYVWLELHDGWPVGTYQCDLSDAAHPDQPLVSSRFRVE